MLSPGKWHLQVPKDREGNLQFRLRLLRLAAKGEKESQAIIEACRQDILFFINAFIWQYNPKKKGLEAVGQFLTWDFQEDALAGRPETTGTTGMVWCYECDKSAAIEKSREMGATWLFLIFELWLFLFHPYVQCLNISKSADAVDCQSPDSLFYKIRFMLRHLPDWLKGEVLHRKMYFKSKRTESVITGEASTGRAGVGGRASVIFIDEFSKIKEDREVRERTASTSDCRFFNSTHEGPDTEFYKLTTTPEIAKIVMHWTQHPEKKRGLYRYDKKTNAIEVLDRDHYPSNYAAVYSEAPAGGPFPGLRSPWYDQKVADIGSMRGVGVELDIDPGGSVSQFFNPLTIRALQAAYCIAPLWEGDITFDRESAEPLGLVPLAGGPIKIWITLKPDGSLPFGKYCAGADISTGGGATPSILSIGNAATGEKVLEYGTSIILPELFAPICVAICRMFQDEHGSPALFGWEHAGPGMTFGKRVLELGYGRIYWREAHATLAGGKVSNIPGWYPSNEAKRMLLEDYRGALESRAFINRSEPALAECLWYRYDAAGNVVHPTDYGGDDPTGARVNHGDRVIADGLAWKMMQQMGIMRSPEQRQIEQAPVGSLAWRRQIRANPETDTAWA